MRIVQFLNWDINSITDYLDTIEEQNFDTIQINPVQPFIDVEGYEWWATYQPLDFKIGNMYGTKEDLIKLCEEAKKRNIKIVVDVITNHLANDGAGRETIPNKLINEKIRNNKNFWKKHPNVNKFNNWEDCITNSIGLPGLDLNNKELQDIILNFLEELKDCGISGFRFDAAKHIGLPSDGVTYFNRVKEFLKNNNLFAYGEFLDGPHNKGKNITNTINDKKNELSDLMYILTEEDSEVNNKNKKITFVESHDTFLNSFGSTKDIEDEEIIDKYIELTKKYENTLFYIRDKSKGKRLFTKNHDRSGYAQKDWLFDKRIRNANLNKGNELTNNIEENKKIEIHHELSIKTNESLNNKLNENSTITDFITIALLNYNLQNYLNMTLNINTYTDYLIQTIVGKIYEEKKNTKALENINYNDFYIVVLNAIKNDINQNKETIKKLELI